MSKGARHPPGFYKLLLIDACDSGYKSRYRPIVKPTVMGVFEVERVVAKRIQGRETAYFVQCKKAGLTGVSTSSEENSRSTRCISCTEPVSTFKPFSSCE